eukprot:TRINITY_DN7499_c0_g3_i2.p2 TRINITY_DN7499_c0_g3~~TRINITY_DN7499_c0_g3_i2.p2  ORF type:complete len:217 (-),score=23.53 TRINITY_DN7499_c0_g3_i2:34-684(-)
MCIRDSPSNESVFYKLLQHYTLSTDQYLHFGFMKSSYEKNLYVEVNKPLEFELEVYSDIKYSELKIFLLDYKQQRITGLNFIQKVEQQKRRKINIQIPVELRATVSERTQLLVCEQNAIVFTVEVYCNRNQYKNKHSCLRQQLPNEQGDRVFFKSEITKYFNRYFRYNTGIFNDTKVKYDWNQNYLYRYLNNAKDFQVYAIYEDTMWLFVRRKRQI